MKKLMMALAVLAPQVAAAQVRSTPSLGMAEGRCRANEPGPAFLITVVGLKDRKGTMKAEVYPANDEDFLQDDNILVGAGKTFRRVVIAVPASGAVQVCIRVPGPGAYGLALLHDRNSDRHFDKGFDGDGLGFPANLDSQGPFKPRLSTGRAVANAGITPITIRMMYRRGLLSFGPLK